MLIMAEGRNKTEKQYFGSFQDQHGKYVIRFVTGLETDPVGMLKALQKAWNKNELSKYIPGYEENMNISEILSPMLDMAGKHIERLKEYYDALGISWGDVDCNPMTDVSEVLKELEVFGK